MDKPRNKAPANKGIPPVTTLIFSSKLLLLLILYIGNKASMAIRSTGTLKCAIAGFLCTKELAIGHFMGPISCSVINTILP